MTHTAQTETAGKPPAHRLLEERSFLRLLDGKDALFAACILAAAAFAQYAIPHHMDIYEAVILWCCAACTVALGWFFKPLRWFVPLSVALAYAGVRLYAGDFDNGGKFLLRYLLSSQSAIMWQCSLIFFALLAYLAGAAVAAKRQTSANILLDMGSALGMASALAGLTGLLVRWHESYLLRPNAGHIPVSNLYEVFILFLVITALMYRYYESKFPIQKLGAFVYFFMSCLVGFVLWYSLARNAQEILPLIPALQSWWMKLHVPANFVGYGAFGIAAMLGVAQLLAIRSAEKGKKSWLPDAAVIEEVMYKAIAVGFLFFTIATILGALWAKVAWGGYWSWDPKETWALIVWLNYAVWLHLRLVSGWRGKIPAWWAVIGLLITAFAFVGVNMFMGGMHSYGGL
ncbi:MAG: c-type cytochrome biogenesis protein CcsB [Neisseria sp.]|nr:c-type cytochrome biogenesis protein CcsB [Neisseria sp.]